MAKRKSAAELKINCTFGTVTLGVETTAIGAKIDTDAFEDANALVAFLMHKQIDGRLTVQDANGQQRLPGLGDAGPDVEGTFTTGNVSMGPIGSSVKLTFPSGSVTASEIQRLVNKSGRITGRVLGEAPSKRGCDGDDGDEQGEPDVRQQTIPGTTEPPPADIMTYPITVLDLDTPWADRLNERGIRTLGDLNSRIIAGATAKEMGFSKPNLRTLIGKLETYTGKYAVTAPADDAESTVAAAGGNAPVPMPKGAKSELTLLSAKGDDGQWRGGWDYLWEYGTKGHAHSDPAESTETFPTQFAAWEWAAQQVLAQWEAFPPVMARDVAIKALETFLSASGDEEEPELPEGDE